MIHSCNFDVQVPAWMIGSELVKMRPLLYKDLIPLTWVVLITFCFLYFGVCLKKCDHQIDPCNIFLTNVRCWGFQPTVYDATTGQVGLGCMKKQAKQAMETSQ